MTSLQTRRRFLGSIAAASAGAVPAFAAGKPNVLLICVDDLRPQLGCYGYQEMRSPNIDRLAAESCVFTRHYVQTAACGPSRSSLLTGKRLSTWDAWDSVRKAQVEPSYPVSFPHVFRRNGYRTVCIGKVSHQPGGAMDDEQRVHQVPFSWDLSYAPVGAWGTPWRAFFSYSGGKAYNKVIRMRKDEPRLPYESAAVTDTGYADGLNAEEAVKQLRELKRRSGPFLLAVGFYKPHLPFNAPKKYWDLYDRKTVGLAVNRAAPKNVDPEISLHHSYEPTTHYDWPSGSGNINNEEAMTLRHGYYACVSYVDAQIGKVLDEVKRLQLERDTIVVLWSDHGWHLGEHGIFGKLTNHELAVRSPLIVKVPGITQAGRRVQGLAESVDLYPTLLDLCGLKGPGDLAGTSLVPMLRNPAHPGKERAYSFCIKGPLMGKTLRTKRYRIVQWTNQEDRTVQVELYDHDTDPDENVNVAAGQPDLVRSLLAFMPAAPAGGMH
jgi:iduronate 2-sulfatase